MCDTCGCTPCSCGGKIVEGNCDGCNKPMAECDCEPKKESEETPETPPEIM
jgi:hypothetical protein